MKNPTSPYLPDLKEAWTLVLVLLLGGGLLQGIFNALLQGLGWTHALLTKALSYGVLFVPLFLYLAHRTGGRLPDSGSLSPKRPPLAHYLLLLVMVPATSLLCEPLLMWIPTPDWFIRLMESMTQGNVWVTLLSVAVLAPLLEEFLCRGLILRGLLAHTSTARAIMWSSLIFALIHLNPWQAIPAFVLGCLFGWVYYRTGNLWTTVFMHSVNNSLAVLLQRWLPDYTATTPLYELFPWHPALTLIAAAGLLMACLAILQHTTEPSFTKHHED